MSFFKISSLGINNPTTIKINGEPTPNQKFEGSWDVPIVHGSQNKTWTVSTFVADKLKELNAKQGTTLSVAYRYNEKSGKNFTDIAPEGDIMMQAQNNPQPQNVATNTGKKQEIGQEKVIRGQIATHLVSGFVAKEGLREMTTEEKRALAALVQLCENHEDWLGLDNGDVTTDAIEFDTTDDRIDVSDLPL